MNIDEQMDLLRRFIDAPDGRMQEMSGYTGKRLFGRRTTFCRDFYAGYRGEPMTEAKLSRYTWSNLG